MRYVALLRGINVGGKNLIKMADLKKCFEKHGLSDVTTYIQSGNVVFSAAKRSELCAELEGVLAKTFGYRASVVLRTLPQMKKTVTGAPKGFGAEPDKYRYDVMFLKDSVNAKKELATFPMKEGVDAAHAATGVIYFSRLVSKATQSKLSRIITLPIYQDMTVRNWNTTTKLLTLMVEDGADSL